jgi:hypothetical protein
LKFFASLSSVSLSLCRDSCFIRGFQLMSLSLSLFISLFDLIF